jgi:hypothetical protein
LLIALILTGLLLRLGLLLISKGSDDALIWEHLASQVQRLGLYDTYRFEGGMNHPPLAGLWAATVYSASRTFDLPFYTLFKIPVVASDAITCLLLFLIYRNRSSSGLLAAAAFAWNLEALLLSGHHCNTDPIYAMLCISAVWLIETQSRPFLAGLALGAAMNIKLIPGLLLIPMLGLSRSRKELLRLLAGLAIMSLPFVWVLIDLGYRFRMRVLGYRPPAGQWGFQKLIQWLSGYPALKPYFSGLADRYVAQSKLLIIACILLTTLAARRSRQIDRYRAAALAVAALAAVTPAFALQYGAIVGVMLFAYDLRAGVVWGALRGMQLFCDYYLGWNGKWPVTSLGGGSLPGPTSLLAMLAWIWIVIFLLRELFIGHRNAATVDAVKPSSITSHRRKGR